MGISIDKLSKFLREFYCYELLLPSLANYFAFCPKYLYNFCLKTIFLCGPVFQKPKSRQGLMKQGRKSC